MLERVPHPDTESERDRPRAPAPSVPSPPAGVSNAALSRALLQRDWRKYKNEKKCKALQNDKERELYGALRDKGFEELQITAAGAGTPNADLVAYDGERLWIIEVKGDNHWLSKDNQDKSGNVPLKQLGQKLMGSRNKDIKPSKVTVSIDETLEGTTTAGRGTALTLMVTNIDHADALLAVESITGNTKQPNYYATTLGQVFTFFNDALDRFEGSSEDDATNVNAYAAQARALMDDWDESTDDAPTWATKNAQQLELVYTKFRQAMAQTQPHAEFAKLDADLQVNVALIPVRQHLPRVARRAVLARTKFKSAQEAQDWFTAAGQLDPRQDEEDDEEWIVRLLSADATYGGGDFTPNYQLLMKARSEANRPQPPQRTPPKGKKLRTVDGAIWNHVINGEIVIDKVGAKKTPMERPKGLHTIHGPNPVAEGYGPKTMVGTHGCYTQAIRPRHAEGETAPESKDKKFQSTFFPDTWDLEDIKEAIEYASQRGNTFEVLSPEKGIGMQLYFNNESYYPNYR